jgi:dCTP diphosphatase
MSEDPRSIDTMARKVREFGEARAWGPFHSPRNLAMALSVEANELLELYLWSDDGDARTEQQRAAVAGEAADVLMCLLNLCARAGVDLPAALDAKLEVAARKYPVERVRGSAMKYDAYPEWEPDRER